jgi:protein-L-isoaspartate(D-aspartate) O-methyltransferase
MSVDFASQRANMVESQVRIADVTDYAIQDAMRVVARETLLPPETAYLAYADVEVEYAPGRWLLKPRDVAKLLQGLRPKAGERALAISAPYAAAVLGVMGLTVTGVDAGAADAAADGFDVAICEGAVSDIPSAWLQVLARPGGRLGAVERRGPVGRGVVIVRTPTTFGRQDLFDCGPPIMRGFEPKPAFVF